LPTEISSRFGPSIGRPEPTFAFFNAWTRKEAILKALGAGIAWPLSDVEVTLAPGELASLLGIGAGGGEGVHWTLRALEPAPGYVAALAVEGAIEALELWDASALVPCAPG
jgi:4'-phosphopantetheinyl transferase